MGSYTMRGVDTTPCVDNTQRRGAGGVPEQRPGVHQPKEERARPRGGGDVPAQVCNVERAALAVGLSHAVQMRGGHTHDLGRLAFYRVRARRARRRTGAFPRKIFSVFRAK
eukprot:2456575-Pyramimonas_sp.AAC.2